MSGKKAKLQRKIMRNISDENIPIDPNLPSKAERLTNSEILRRMEKAKTDPNVLDIEVVKLPNGQTAVVQTVSEEYWETHKR